MDRSGCPKAGELLLGTLAGVNLDSGDRPGIAGFPSSHHDPVLEFNGTTSAENVGDKKYLQ